MAPLGLIQLALPGLRARAGAIVNVTSDAAVEAVRGLGRLRLGEGGDRAGHNVLAAEEPAVRVWRVDPGDLRTRMHQEAFPGEDIGDRPLPETVVPAFLRLVTSRPASGRVRLAEVTVPS